MMEEGTIKERGIEFEQTLQAVKKRKLKRKKGGGGENCTVQPVELEQLGSRCEAMYSWVMNTVLPAPPVGPNAT